MSDKKRRIAINKPISPSEEVGTYKKDGHLLNESLRFHYPGNGPEPNLFSTLEKRHVKEEIKQHVEVETEQLALGVVNISSQKRKMLDSLSHLLHDKSQNNRPKESNYYIGNAPIPYDEYGSKNHTNEPRIITTYYEMAQYYTGKKHPSGSEIQTVIDILADLQEERYCIKYAQRMTRTEGNKIHDSTLEIESYSPLLDVTRATKTDRVNGEVIGKTEKIMITLHRIFRDDIDHNYVVMPTDINQRTAIANGGKKVKASAMKFRDYLLREHSRKRFTVRISTEKLCYIISEKAMKESRKSRVKKELQEAIKICKKLNLLNVVKVSKSKTYGEEMMVFTLNEKWF